jgi:hypothetical protein
MKSVWKPQKKPQISPLRCAPVEMTILLGNAGHHFQEELELLLGNAGHHFQEELELLLGNAGHHFQEELELLLGNAAHHFQDELSLLLGSAVRDFQKNCHLDRSVAEWRDLRFLSKSPDSPSVHPTKKR